MGHFLLCRLQPVAAASFRAVKRKLHALTRALIGPIAGQYRYVCARKKTMTAIVDVHARQILDSRGNPTVEVDVTLEDGSMGRAAVPSGASTGAHEADELRDGDKGRWGGKGVEQGGGGGQRRDRGGAVAGSTPRISGARRGDDRARRQRNKGRLGANAILGVSARGGQGGGRCARFAALSLCRRLSANLLPVPMMNIFNGGVHADNPIDFQEFMVVPVGAPSFAEALRMGAEIFHALKAALKARATSLRSATKAASPAISPRPAKRSTSLLPRSRRPASSPARTSISRSIGRDRIIRTARYRMKGESRILSPTRWSLLTPISLRNYPIYSIEDGMSEDDWEGWRALTWRSATACSLSATICSSPMSRG